MDTSHLKKEYSHLVSGKSYKIAKTFDDYDKIRRFEGEVWKFVGSGFLPYESGLSLFFRIKGKLEHVRLQMVPDEQLQIAENLQDYLVEQKDWWRFW
jgi:hypothetical protein